MTTYVLFVAVVGLVFFFIGAAFEARARGPRWPWQGDLDGAYARLRRGTLSAADEAELRDAAQDERDSRDERPRLPNGKVRASDPTEIA